MSIIYDALKKVEKNFEQNLNTASKDAGAQEKKPILGGHSAQPGARKYLVYIFAVLLVAAIVNGYFTLFAPRRPLPAQTAAKTPSPPSIRKEQPIPLQPPTPSSAPKEEIKLLDVPTTLIPAAKKSVDAASFILNGIFFAPDGGYALVNNQIVKENDVISRATVKKITAELVVLELDGAVIKLSRPR